MRQVQVGGLVTLFEEGETPEMSMDREKAT